MLKHVSLLTLGILVISLHGAPALAQTVFVNESFDGYADQSALEAVWTPELGSGVIPISTAGFLLPAAESTALPAPVNDPPDMQGKAVAGNFNGGVNRYSGSSFALQPSASESVVLRGDIFLAAENEVSRQTIGLRNDTIDADPGLFGPQLGLLNLLEIGTWNAATCDPTADGCSTSSSVIQDPSDPNYISTTQFAYRLAIWEFGSYGTLTQNGVEIGEHLVSPNWQYFPFDPALDTRGSDPEVPDGRVDILDIGEGWHTFEATVTETDITLTLDLYRDGLNNASGAAGVDSTVNIEVVMNDDPANPGEIAPFTSLRVGGPSGLASQNGNTGDAAPAAFDNIYLALEPPAPDGLPGDFNNDGVVDLADYTVWRNNLGGSFDLNGNGDDNGVSAGVVDTADYTLWKSQFGSTATPALSTVASVPEPSAVGLLALCGILVWRGVPRRSRVGAIR